jgi:hypothetical protein
MTGPIGAVDLLGDDALGTEQASVREDGRAILSNVFVEHDVRLDIAHQPRQRVFRLAPGPPLANERHVPVASLSYTTARSRLAAQIGLNAECRRTANRKRQAAHPNNAFDQDRRFAHALSRMGRTDRAGTVDNPAVRRRRAG